MRLSKLRKNLFIISYPLSVLYGIATSIRNKLYDTNILSSTKFDIPVISIGNITAGGTGKTPHVEYLIRLLKDRFKIAMLSRGYKRKTKDFRLAKSNSDINEIGDEPKQIKQKFAGITVAVDKNRVNGVKKIIEKQKGINAVILDDAFQHRKIQPGLSIVLIDFNNPVFRDYLLPMGNLREKKHELKRAQIVIVTKTPRNLKPIEKRIWVKNLKLFPYQFLYFSTYKYGDPQSIFNKSKRKLDINELKNNKPDVILITGIANPMPLRKEIEQYTKKIIHLDYPDHYRFTEQTTRHIRNRYNKLESEHKYIFTTEKNAMNICEKTNIHRDIKNAIYYVPIKVEFIFGGKEQFNKYIIKYVRENKEVNRLHK